MQDLGAVIMVQRDDAGGQLHRQQQVLSVHENDGPSPPRDGKCPKNRDSFRFAKRRIRYNVKIGVSAAQFSVHEARFERARRII